MNLKIGHHVVLVHGIFDDGRIFDRMRSALEDRGLVTHAIDLNPASGRTGLHPLARQLAGFIDVIAVAKVDLVGFSMGGIVARVFMQSLGGHARVRRLVTIASPHHGTHMGHLMPFGGGREMRRGSRFLADLNTRADTLAAHTPLSLWTPYDLMILPHSSAILGVGETVRVPVPWHRLMASDARVIRHVAAHLA